MPTSVKCSCGNPVTFGDNFAGKSGTCPACGRAVIAPARQTRHFGFEPLPQPKKEPPAITHNPVLRPPRTESPVMTPNPAAGPPTGLTRQLPRPKTLPPLKPALFLNSEPEKSAGFYRFWLFSAALIPLVMTLFSANDNLDKRIEETKKHLNPDGRAKIEYIEHPPKELAREIDFDSEEFAQLKKSMVVMALMELSPEHKLDGALLPRKTWFHWAYAGASALAGCVLAWMLFPRGNTTMFTVVKAGLFTGTIGILMLLIFQFVALYTDGISFRGGGKAVIIWLIIKFIGFSYRAALDPSYGFFLSFVGFTCGVGLCEEMCKAIPLLWQKETLNWKAACIIGVGSGLGFGVSEGITYASDYYNGIRGADIYVIRFVSCVALHGIWSASVGIALNRGQKSPLRAPDESKLLELLKALAVPMVLHGLYDTLLKKEMEMHAVFVAAFSFCWLAWQIEQAFAEEAKQLKPAVGY